MRNQDLYSVRTNAAICLLSVLGTKRTQKAVSGSTHTFLGSRMICFKAFIIIKIKIYNTNLNRGGDWQKRKQCWCDLLKMTRQGIRMSNVSNLWGYLAKVISPVTAERKNQQALRICKLWSRNQPVDFKSNPAGSLGCQQKVTKAKNAMLHV